MIISHFIQCYIFFEFEIPSLDTSISIVFIKPLRINWYYHNLSVARFFIPDVYSKFCGSCLYVLYLLIGCWSCLDNTHFFWRWLWWINWMVYLKTGCCAAAVAIISCKLIIQRKVTFVVRLLKYTIGAKHSLLSNSRLDLRTDIRVAAWMWRRKRIKLLLVF
jgi:hypothetical protein